jgi:hypothetical protein
VFPLSKEATPKTTKKLHLLLRGAVFEVRRMCQAFSAFIYYRRAEAGILIKLKSIFQFLQLDTHNRPH